LICLQGRLQKGMRLRYRGKPVLLHAPITKGHWFSLMGTFLPFEITTYAI